MHLRGKSFEFQAVYPKADASAPVGAAVRFRLAIELLPRQAAVLAGRSKIECTAHFDNSKNNRNNPDPAKLVHWGEQTWDEMMIGFVDYTYVEAAAKEEKN